MNNSNNVNSGFNIDSNNAKNAFDTLENIDAFKADITLIQASIEMSAAVTANDVISADKARLTMINRQSRCKRLKKINKLSDSQIDLILSNSSADKLEKTAIYALDKIVQIAQFLTGNAEIFGRGRNNSLMYAIRGIAKNTPDSLDNGIVKAYLTRFGQPHESADTQTVSTCKALLALDCVTMIKAGHYTVNYQSKLMQALIKTYA